MGLSVGRKCIYRKLLLFIFIYIKKIVISAKYCCLLLCYLLSVDLKNITSLKLLTYTKTVKTQSDIIIGFCPVRLPQALFWVQTIVIVNFSF